MGIFLDLDAHRGIVLVVALRYDIVGFPGGFDGEGHRLLLAGVEAGRVLLLGEGEFAGVRLADGHGDGGGPFVVVDALGHGEVDEVVLFVHDGGDPVGIGHIHPDGTGFAVRQFEFAAAVGEDIGVFPGIGGIEAELLGRDLGRGVAGGEFDRGIPRIKVLVPVDGDGHTVACDGQYRPRAV